MFRPPTPKNEDIDNSAAAAATNKPVRGRRVFYTFACRTDSIIPGLPGEAANVLDCSGAVKKKRSSKNDTWQQTCASVFQPMGWFVGWLVEG